MKYTSKTFIDNLTNAVRSSPSSYQGLKALNPSQGGCGGYTPVPSIIRTLPQRSLDGVRKSLRGD